MNYFRKRERINTQYLNNKIGEFSGLLIILLKFRVGINGLA
jgi:hypothetical protein